jgi:ceramide glucosyltransferase
LADFPSFDARIFIEAEDPNLSTYDGASGLERNLGPNPKIRNMSRAYKEAKSDIVWIIDSNVWISPGVAGRMVDKLCGYRLTASGSVTVTKPFKFVHQLPLVVDSVGASVGEEARGLLQHSDVDAAETAPSDGSSINADRHGVLKTGGGRLEEMFMAGSHAKFYTAINTVAVAPCIVGKSNMFRRSHLDALTQPEPRDATGYAPGIDYFSDNICEDHLIGDLLWRKKVPAEVGGERFGRHALVFGDVAVQPMKGMGIREYTARRVRWLRVRKWTVLLATLVEPGVESLLCSAYGAFAATTLPVLRDALGFEGTWGEFVVVWAGSVLTWCAMDWFTFQKLHRMSTVELDAETPSFARPPPGGRRRPFGEWVAAWVGREVLALPIWTYAVLGGTTVKWRNREFKVGMDMKVREVTREGQYKGGYGINAMKAMNGNGKARRD